MFERLNQIEAKYDELTQALASPEVINDSAKYQKTARTHSEFSEIVEKYREFKDMQRGIQESKAILADESDAELREYAQEELVRLEERLAETERWKVEVLSTSESRVGGLKEVIAIIEGRGAFSQMKYGSGVHRVQRVPDTEQQGRVHTSAVTVAVLPEAEDVDIRIEAKDLRIDTFCSSGPG